MLSRRHRLRSEADYRRIYRYGRPFSAGAILFRYIFGTRRESRIGIVVGTKVSRRATERNRLRRRLRELARDVLRDHPSGLDLVILPRPPAKMDAVSALRGAFVALAQNLARHTSRRSP